MEATIRSWFTVALTILLSSAGFALIHLEYTGFGLTLFVIIPLCIGYVATKKPTFNTSSLFALITGFAFLFYLHITDHLGDAFNVLFYLLMMGPWLFMIVASISLLLVAFFAGARLGYWIRKEIKPVRIDEQK